VARRRAREIACIFAAISLPTAAAPTLSTAVELAPA
jgi:hypothetical protein